MRVYIAHELLMKALEYLAKNTSCANFAWHLLSASIEKDSNQAWVSSFQSLSLVRLFVTPWTAACQVSLSITNSRSLLKLMSIKLVMPSNSVVPFSSHLQSFQESGSFQLSQFFASGGQSIGVSASASILPMDIQDWFPLGWTGWISLQSKGCSRVFSNTTVQKHQFFDAQPSSQSTHTSIHDHRRNHSLD